MSDPTSAPQHLAHLLAEHDLDEPFPARVLAETQRWVDAPGIDDPELTDLTGLPFCTIDEVESRDLDQALCIERAGDRLVAWYAIADAAHFVRLGSALFDEALRRGATAYLPGVVVPMLPEPLSEGVVSLNPHEPRRALVWRMEVDEAGTCVSCRIEPARIRSRAKLAYDSVQAWFDGGTPPTDDARVLESLRQLPELGARRLAAGDERGVVRYRRRELSVGLDDRGLRFVAHGEDRNDVERFNEQLSLMCNVEGARAMARGEATKAGDVLQPIYRVHEPPEEQLLARMEAQLRALARLHELGDDWVWAPGDSRSLAEFLDALPREGAPGRIAHAIHRQAVLMNRAAVYRAAPGPHHGVGAPLYGRFSAPMREIVGVFLHQELAELRAGAAVPVPPRFADAGALRDAVIDAAAASRSRQRVLDRQLNRIALDHLFEQASEPLAATVMGVSRGRVHVQLDAPPIDAKVYFRHAEAAQGRLRADDLGLAALRADGTPWVVVGDPVRLLVRGRDHASDRWDLELERA